MIRALSAHRLFRAPRIHFCLEGLCLALLVLGSGCVTGKYPRAATARAEDRQAAYKTVAELYQDVVCFAGIELAPILPGTFMMGSPVNEIDRSSDETQRQVTLTTMFWLGRTEVTQAQYEAVVGSNPSERKGADRPVTDVSWHDAVAFCEKLTQMAQIAGKLPPGQVFRLPTEAEWEYACRAGTTTAFHYGDSLDASMANFDGNYPYGAGKKGEYRETTIAVGQFIPNAWGLYDMHGNVWEWCHDWYGDYPAGAVRDPRGPDSGAVRVVRGGGWVNVARRCRSADRDRGWPGYRSGNGGLRVARSAPPVQ